MDESFATRLASSRKYCRLSQAQLAAKIGKKQSFIGNLESNARKGTTFLTELAFVLGVDAHWLKTGTETIIAGDRRINEIVKLLKATSEPGRAVVLDKAREMAHEYPAEPKSKAA